MNAADRQRLAVQFMRNAVKVSPGDNVWIEFQGPKAEILAEACKAEVQAAGAIPHMKSRGSAALNAEIKGMSEADIEARGQKLLGEMKQMQAYIRIRDDYDQAKLSIPDAMKAAYKKSLHAMTEHRIKNTRWLVTEAPTEEFAKACGMTLPEFEDFYRDVCLVDYGLMGEAVKPLQKIMTEGEKVRIYSPAQETDLTFSIKGIPAVPCTGTLNIPDGECFTAPVKDSINGTIKFGPSAYDGERFKWIKLTFKEGKVVDAQAETPERTKALNRILDTDEGSRYTGEFAINFNPYVKHPTGSILFDEKIDGGLHLTPGQCYDEAPNGNNSAVHWDMVHIQRPDYGGGELWIDDRLIRKDGIFVVPELEALNPANLIAASAKPSNPAP